MAEDGDPEPLRVCAVCVMGTCDLCFCEGNPHQAPYLSS